MKKAVRWEPRLQEINEQLDFKDAEIAWRHFANQTSCYQLVEKPGAAFDYNDWQMALFWDTLFLKVYGSSYDKVDEQVFHPLLTDRLGCQDNPTMMAFGDQEPAWSCQHFCSRLRPLRLALLTPGKLAWQTTCQPRTCNDGGKQPFAELRSASRPQSGGDDSRPAITRLDGKT